MQVDKNLSFDQFSHDLTLALEEETLRCGTGSRWGLRRRTRSTGNLPCPPQPTEDSSSSSPTDPPTNNDNNNNDNFTPSAGANNNSILSDSDDRQSFALAFKLRQTPMSGNFESDSLNENFSPSRPNIRRKRKFKRMAVEYETTPSTPHTTVNPIFPLGGTVTKRRVLKHNQENFRANLFFGKRKRPHRDRYEYYESHKHSSSVPRQRGYLSQKDGLSYLEYKSRNRASSMSTSKSHHHGHHAMEKILPLNKSIVSKIEKISQDSRSKMNFNFTAMPLGSSTDQIDSSAPVVHFQSSYGGDLRSELVRNPLATATTTTATVSSDMDISTNVTDDVKINLQKMTQKSGSFESALPTNNLVCTNTATTTSTSSTSSAVHLNNCVNKLESYKKKVKPSASSTSGYHANIPINNAASSHHHHHHPHHVHHHQHHHHHKHKQSRRKMPLQFVDQADFMDCGNFNDFLSSSSLSSSESEAEETNESDHEGDDELTDWPGHEAMINFASKNEFKRANNNKKASMMGTMGNKLPQIKQQDDIIQDDDTLMSADEAQDPTTSEDSPIFPMGEPQTPQARYVLEEYHRKYGMNSGRVHASNPINIIGALDSNMMQGSSSTSGVVADCGYGSSFAASSYNYKQPIESEMSGETSNHFLSSPNTFCEVREIRAGCRRVHDERPGFSIITSFNEDLLKFLQDDQQRQLKIFDIQEYDKILELAKLYSLNITRENGCIILSKTSNTMQAVKVSKEHNKYFFSDYKRRCVGGDTE